MNRNPLTEEQLSQALAQLDGWEAQSAGILKTYTFGSYADGVAFAIKVALLAEKMNHHPDALTIGWKKVTVVYVTHDAGGITELDVQAAQKVDRL